VITRYDSGWFGSSTPRNWENRKLASMDTDLEKSLMKTDGFSGGFAYKLLEDHEGQHWVGCAPKDWFNSVTIKCSVSLPGPYQKLGVARGSRRRDLGRTINNKPLRHVPETVCY